MKIKCDDFDFSKKPTIVFIVFISTIFFYNVFSSDESIKIDNIKHILVAPMGENYTWYYNGTNIQGEDNRQIGSIKSGEYKVDYIDKNGKQTTQIIRVAVQQGTIHKIYIIGDSTVCNYKESNYPQMGWGQVLQLFFDNSMIEIVNKAIGGRSSRSFYQEGRWTEVVNSLTAGDYVFIQFGHNDRDWTKEERYTDTAAYKDYLRIYVNDSRAKGAIPVLVSPMIMNAYNGSTLRNVFTEGSNDYRGAMLQVAQELNVSFVDLNMKSYDLVNEVGKEYATHYLYLCLDAGEYPNYSSGYCEGTHFQEMGALAMAGLIVEGIQELDSDTNLTDLISAMVPTYNVDVSTNLPSAGVITKSSKYPAGAQVTLKTRLKSGFNFYRWEDDSMNVVSENNLTKFIMEPHDSSFVANIKDCNGTEGGSATFDKCGSCTGGTTGNLECTNGFQCESACFYDGTIESQTINSATRKYINTASNSNPGFTYGVLATKDTIYQMSVNYFAEDSNQYLKVFLNNDDTGIIIDVDTINNWVTAYFELEMTSGINSIRIESNSLTGGILYDYFASYTTGLSRCSCTLNINNSEKKKLNVYPNPFYNSINISGNGRFNYMIYNFSGLMIKQGICENSCDIGSEMEKGIYILKTIDKTGSSTLLIHKM